MTRISKKGKDHLATIAGYVFALTSSYLLIDWANFTWSKHNIAVLVFSTLNVLAGHYTALKSKEDEN